MLSKGDFLKAVASGSGLTDTICNLIIRPPRFNYSLEDLGPPLFCFKSDDNLRYKREDLEVENMRGMIIRYSWFKPLERGDKVTRLPCLIYCHANSGSRLDSMEALYILQHGFSFVSLDFCGSGLSDGEYISLGIYERQDLAAVVEYLHSRPEVDGIALWGRSMGAVTSIMYAAKDISIRCLICDSPFASLRLLIEDLVIKHGGRTAKILPKAVVRYIVGNIRKHIVKRAAFDIDDLDTVKYASQCSVPALILHGKNDTFVAPEQSMQVRDAFRSSCLYELTKGGHNDERSNQMLDLIAAFLKLYCIEKPKALREQQEAALQYPSSFSIDPGANCSTGDIDKLKIGKGKPDPHQTSLPAIAEPDASNDEKETKTNSPFSQELDPDDISFTHQETEESLRTSMFPKLEESAKVASSSMLSFYSDKHP